MSWTIDTCQNEVSADHYGVTILRGSSLELIEVTCVFFSCPLTRNWPSIGSQAQVGLTFRNQDT